MSHHRFHVAALGAAAALAISGCGGCDDPHSDGDAHVVAPASVVAGQPFTIDLSGSTVTSSGECPAQIDAKVTGPDEASAAREAALAGRGADAVDASSKTFGHDGARPCAITDARLTLTAARAATPGTRQAELYVRVFTGLFFSDKRVPITITTPGADTTPVAQPAPTAPQPDPAPPAPAAPAAPAANEPPIVDLFAESEPLVEAQAAYLDARLSRDPEGKALTYEWDPENDGTFRAKESTGRFKIPATSVAGTSMTIAVRVTDADGHSTTKTRTIEVKSHHVMGTVDVSGSVPPAADDTPQVRSGESVFLFTDWLMDGTSFGPPGGVDPDAIAVDVNDDGVKDVDVDPSTRHTNIAFTGAGLRRVTAKFLYAGEVPTIGRKLVNILPAARRDAIAAAKAKAYRARATVRLSGSKVLTKGKIGVANGLTTKGTIVRGTLTLKTPAKAGGVKRPAVADALNGGRYVASLDGALGERFADGDYAFAGTATVLARAKSRKDKATLACFRVRMDSLRTTNALTFLGGTGRAKGMQINAAVPAFTLSAADLRKPLGGAGTVTVAAAGKPTPLPSSCRALRGKLQ